MADINALAASLPIDQIAAKVGEDPDAVRRAVDVALPALLGGLHANAQDPGGAASLAAALDQHTNDVATPPVNVDDVDVAEGHKVAAHIFGPHQDQVVSKLGSTSGVSSSLVSKVMPMLAPIVLSYVAKQVGGAGSAGGAAGGGALSSVLSSVLGGAASGAGSSKPAGGAGDLLGGVLGGLLGGGRKS